MIGSHFILYVADQAASTEFYSRVLEIRPRLNVPGMTEFELSSNTVFGLMPNQSAARLLGIKELGINVTSYAPGAELYLLVTDPGLYHARALNAGAREVSPLQPRDWGHTAAYSLDPDAHVLAFASVISA